MSTNNNRILSEPISYQELKSIRNLIISGIYKIENLINHKVYIGQSKNIIHRLRFGHSKLKDECNPYLKKSFRKYGFDNFSFEIIKETYDLDYWEIFLIQIYHATDNKYGYNILPGGEGGDPEVTKRSWDNPTTRQKRKSGTERYWSSPQGIKQKQINSQKAQGTHSTKGKHWYNNGIINTSAFTCPEGFVPGRLGDFTQTEEAKQKRRDWYSNLSDEEKKVHNKKAAAARKGKPKSDTCKQNISKANKGRKYYNNGIIEVMRFECPPGFVPGRCPTSKNKIKQGMNH